MTLPTSLKAYPDCEALWDAALADKAGARARVRSQDAAINLRSRMHYYRNLLRRQNKELFPPDHPQWGTSVYDHLYIQMFPEEGGGNWWLYVTPRDTADMVIEGLSDSPPLLDGPPPIDGHAHEVRQLAAPDDTDDLADAVDEREANLHIDTIERRV